MKESELLKILYEKVAQRFNQGNCNAWQNKIFVKLEIEIFKASGILISASTLKRLFGKVATNEGYTPQSDTKNALSIYAHNEFGTHEMIPSSSLSHKIYQNPDSESFFTKETITSLGFSSNELYLTEYRYFSETGINLDDFKSSFKAMNPGSISAVYCDHVAIYFHGAQGILGFRFVKPGCTRWAQIILGDKVMHGENYPMDFMGYNFHNFREIGVSAHNDTVRLYLDHQLLFQKKPDQPLGKLMGISVRFTGLGEFSDFELESGDKRLFIPTLQTLRGQG